MSIMKTIFSFGNNRKSRKTHSAGMRFQPQLEPLEDRHLLAAASLLPAVATGTLGPSDAYAEVILTVNTPQSNKAPVLGIQIDATTPGFNPSAISVFDSNGVKVPNSAIKHSDGNYANGSSSLLLVQLAPGDYSIRVSGDRSTFGSFTCDVFLPGDLNRDHTVSSHESTTADAAFLAGTGSLTPMLLTYYEKLGITGNDISACLGSGVINSGSITNIELDAIAVNSGVGRVEADIVTQTEKPVLSLQVVTESAVTPADIITTNPAVKGTVTVPANVTTFQAQFAGATTWTNVTLNSNGSFTVDAELMKSMAGSPVGSDGAVTNGRYEITFRAVDRFGYEATDTLSYVVIADNVSPTANNSSYNTDAYDTVSGSLSSLVSHKDQAIGNILTFVAGTYTSAEGVSVTIGANGSFQYVQGDKFASLQEGQQTTDTFTYTVRDSLGRTKQGTITINITGVNARPFLKNAIPDQTTNQDANKTIDVLPYFDDPNDGDALSIVAGSLSVPANSGSVSLDSQGRIVFNPGNDFKSLPAGESRTVEIAFVITDNATTPLTVSGTVKVLVSGLNDAPVAVNATAAVDANGTVEKDVTVGCTIVDTGATVVLDTIVTQPGKGIATITADGKIKFDPDGQFSNLKQGVTETVTLTFRVKSSLDATKTSEATLTITVTGVNTPPVISGDYAATTAKRDTLEILQTALLALASDVNGDPLSISRVESTTPGVTVTWDQANGKVIYNPGSAFQQLTAGQTATDTFKFWVSDGYAETEGTVNVTLTGSNDPLQLNDQTLSVTSSGTGTTLSAGTVVLASYSNAYEFEIVGTPTGGPSGQPMPTFSINKDTGIISVSKNNLPDTTAPGEEYVLTIKVTNPNDLTDTDTATIKIQVVTKTPPVVPTTPLPLTTSEDATSAVTNTITGVTHDAPFVFETSLTPKSFKIDGVDYPIPTGFIASVNVNTGVVSFNPNGKFDIIPQGKNGILILEFTVRDTQYGVTATGTVEVTITGVNSQPFSTGAIPDQTINQNGSRTLDVRTYFDDPDIGDVLSVKAGSVSVTGGGSVRINSAGSIVFTPGDDFKYLADGQSAEAVITFVIEDSGGLTVNGTFKVIVTGLNDLPVATDYDAPAVDKNKESAAIAASTVASDPDDGETATLEYCWIGRGTESYSVSRGQEVIFANGDKVKISSNGRTLTFTPGPTFANNGKDNDVTATFDYKVKDVQGGESNSAKISILVKGLNDPPTPKQQFDDCAEVMGTVKTFDLRDYFNGQNLTFTVDKGSDPSNMLEVSVSGNTLTIRFLSNYDSKGNREPVQISITATNSDNVSSEPSTFKAATIPQTTLEVVALPVAKSASGSSTSANHSSIPAEPQDFTVQVGEEYYIEIWISDTLYQAQGLTDYAKGLLNTTISLTYNSNAVEIVDVNLASAFTVAYSYTSTPGRISNVGGMLMMNSDDTGVNGDSFRMVRILVRATGTEDPNFQFVRSDEIIPSEFYFSRNANSSTDQADIAPDQIKTVTPSITHTAGAPLLAEETPEIIVTGGVYPRVVTTPTNTSTNGTVAAIPDNADWIHEWQTHWVELWVKASDAAYFLNGTCDLNYNTEYFTAVEVELSPAFSGNSKAVINDALGKVTGIGGDATRLVSDNGYVLLGRVKFQSIGDDNVAFSEAWYAHDLGITLENVKVTTSAKEVLSFAGKSPRTELWAVPYDTNDNGTVMANDFTQFARAFLESGQTDSYIVSAFDFNKDGNVDQLDFTFFAKAFVNGITRESGLAVPFPLSFTQRYVGKTLDADSAATVSKIIDVANKAWLSALGLDRPVEIQIVVQDFGAGNVELANAQITAVDAQGRPLKGIITLDSTAAGMGWYSQITEPVANGRYDLFTVLLHEMGHVYGFNTSYDAFNAVVGEYVSQLDASLLHAADSNDLMYATLATGVRKYISSFDVAIVTGAYEAAQADNSLGFRNSTAALTAGVSAPQESLTPDQKAFVALDNDGFVTTMNLPVFAFTAPAQQMIDTDTATRLHAMGLAVAMPITMQQRDESRISFFVEQVYSNEGVLFDLSDDLMTLHQPQDADESELALIGLTMDWDV